MQKDKLEICNNQQEILLVTSKGLQLVSLEHEPTCKNYWMNLRYKAQKLITTPTCFLLILGAFSKGAFDENLPPPISLNLFEKC